MHISFLQTAISQASDIARESFGKVSHTTKQGDPNQVLTETDLKIGQTLIALIQKEYPDHNIIDEEAGVIDQSSPYTWVIDPVDGTSNFAAGVPTYGTMLAFLKDDKPILSAIALPSLNETYLAEYAQGATLNDKPIQVTNQTQLNQTLSCYQLDSYPDQPEKTHKEAQILGELVLNIRNLRTSNSVFDQAQVAKGAYGVVMNQTCKIWDSVAQDLLITEAGGSYTDFWGNPIDYSKPLSKAERTFTYCAGAPVLHAQAQSIISQFM